MFWPLPSSCASTCVTTGAVIGAFVGALLTGVVTEGALVPVCITPFLTLEATSANIEEPAGGRKRWTQENDFLMFANQKVSDAGPESAGRVCVCVCVLVRHHDVVQLVQSSLSGPVHCRHVTSHRWQLPCGLKYSPADGEQHKSPLKSSFMTISNEIPVLQGRTAQFFCLQWLLRKTTSFKTCWKNFCRHSSPLISYCCMSTYLGFYYFSYVGFWDEAWRPGCTR